MIINLMEASDKPSQANDFAVAKAMNEEVYITFVSVALGDTYGVSEYHEIPDLNRAYVLLVNELEKIYARNSELRAIKPEPIWRRFDMLKTNTEEMPGYLIDDEGGMLVHNAKVEKLCIINGVDDPAYTPEQQELMNTIDVLIKRYASKGKEKLQSALNDWQIPLYTLDYDPIRGTIKINGVYQLNKRSTNDSSNIDKLLAKGMKQPNELFDPELRTEKSLSSIIGNAGFTPTLRKLFIPVARKGKGILVRPAVSRAVADAEGIDTTDLDLILKELGSVTEPKST